MVEDDVAILAHTGPMPAQMSDPKGPACAETGVGMGTSDRQGVKDGSTASQSPGRSPVTAQAFRFTATRADTEARPPVATRLVTAVEASRLAQGLPSRVTDPVVLRHIAIVFRAPKTHPASCQ
jgi:hypothetical protein